MGITAAQKRLFFNLRKIESSLKANKTGHANEMERSERGRN